MSETSLEVVESLKLQAVLGERAYLEVDSFLADGPAVSCAVRYDGNSIPVRFSLEWKTSEDRQPIPLIFNPQDCIEKEAMEYGSELAGDRVTFLGRSQGNELFGFVDVDCIWTQHHCSWYPTLRLGWSIESLASDDDDIASELPVYDLSASAFLPGVIPTSLLSLYEPADRYFIRPLSDWLYFAVEDQSSFVLSASAHAELHGDRWLLHNAGIKARIRTWRVTDSPGTIIKWSAADDDGRACITRASGELIFVWRLGPYVSEKFSYRDLLLS